MNLLLFNKKPLSKGISAVLDFMSEKLDSRISFSRTSNATRVNAQGLVEYAPHNLLTYSENFDNAVWVKTSATVTANSIAAPTGTTTADYINCSATATNLSQTYTVSVSAGTVYSATVYVKGEGADIGKNVWFGLRRAGAGVLEQVFSQVTLTSSWQSVSVSLTFANAQTGVIVDIRTNVGANPASNFYLWGAQLNIGSLQPYNSTSVKNLLGYSQNFEDAAWTKSNSSIAVTPVMGPLGFVGAEKLVENTATSTHFVLQSATATAGTIYTASVYIKKAERDFAHIGLLNSESPFDSLVGIVNLNTGAITTTTFGTVTGVNAQSTTIGNDWYRITLTGVVGTSTTTLKVAIYTATSSGRSYTGDGTSGIYIFGAQLSDSASLDPYSYNFGAAPTSTAYYGPRFDYDPVTLAPKGLLIEEQRTNICQYSGDYTQWSLSEASTSGLFTTPTGSQSPIFLASANAAAHRINKSGLSASGTLATTVCSYGAFLYKPEGSDVGSLNFRLRSASGNGQNIALDVTGSTSTTTFNFVASVPFGTNPPAAVTSSAITIQNYGNGVFRVSIASAVSSGVDNISQIDIGFGTVADTAAGTVNTKIGVWGLSAEAGAFPTSYIPTTSAAVTRAADNASMTGTNFSSWYTQSEGTIYSQWMLGGDNTSINVYNINDTTDATYIRNRYGSAGTVCDNAVAISGTVQATLNTSNQNILYAQYKNAMTYKQDDFARSSNGLLVTDTLGNIPTVTQMNIGCSATGLAQLNGHIQSIKYYPRRLANDNLQRLTR